MKTWLIGMLMAGLAVALLPDVSEAKRLGGGKPAGMQRAAPDKPAAPAAAPNTPAAPAAAAAPTAGATAAPAAAKRSWMGPIAGLAAGLGLAALFSHLGLGGELASFVMLALLAVVAVFAIRWLIRRFSGAGAQGLRYAPAGGASAGDDPSARRLSSSEPGAMPPAPLIGSALTPPIAVPDVAPASASTPAVPAGLSLPADFDAEGFERVAKMIFIRLQAANDSADLDDLRTFTTPELFASLRVDLQERGSAAQHTDVVQVDAKLIDFAQEDERQIASVRFKGLVREETGADATPFDEVWHLVKPRDDSRAWAIAGIQQRQ